MRLLSSITLLLITAVIVTGCASDFYKPKVTSEYDDFEDYTVVETNWAPIKDEIFGDPLKHAIKMKAFYICSGDTKQCEATNYVVMVRSTSKGWRYLRSDYKEITILIDGERIRKKELDYEGDVIYGGEVSESFNFRMTPDEFKKFALSSKPRIKIIYDEVTVGQKQMNAFKRLYYSQTDS